VHVPAGKSFGASQSHISKQPYERYPTASITWWIVNYIRRTPQLTKITAYQRFERLVLSALHRARGRVHHASANGILNGDACPGCDHEVLGNLVPFLRVVGPVESSLTVGTPFQGILQVNM